MPYLFELYCLEQKIIPYLSFGLKHEEKKNATQVNQQVYTNRPTGRNPQQAFQAAGMTDSLKV